MTTILGGDTPCVCGFIHPCCRYLVEDHCPHKTPGDHPHAPAPATPDGSQPPSWPDT
jgi:hypothetical protein